MSVEGSSQKISGWGTGIINTKPSSLHTAFTKTVITDMPTIMGSTNQLTRHPSDRRQRLAIKRKKYEEETKSPEATPRALRKRKSWLKLQEAENELRSAYSGVIER